MAQTASSWTDLPRRIFTVAIGVPFIILLLQHTVTSWLFFQGAHLICLLEWRTLVPLQLAAGETSPLPQYLVNVFSIASLLITIIPSSLLPPAFMASSFALRLLPHLPTCQKVVKSKQSAEYLYLTIQHYQFGLIYLSIGFHFVLQIAASNRGAYHIGNLLFVVWMSDTGALIFGRIMKSTEQKHQAESADNRKGFCLEFLQSISPGKTMYGLLGAIITGPISAMLYPMAFASTNDESLEDENNPLVQRATLGFILAITGIIGDLAESSVKRLSTKKDSGKLLPGHGGVVDRFDSLLSSAVVYYYWVSL
jgi:phosphatidate cytidylyltransferase